MTDETIMSVRGEERESTLPIDLYFSDYYFSYKQLWSMSEQIHRIYALKPRRVLEIGIGNGFVSTYLKRAGIQVTTLDINPELKPDIVAPLHELESHVRPDEYDLISCCEVLEHMPFALFEPTMDRFARLVPRLFMTLPNAGFKYGVGGLIQAAHRTRWIGSWRMFRSAKYSLPAEHFWEVDHSSETTLRKIQSLLKSRYNALDTSLFLLNPYHRHFTCSKILENASCGS